MRFSKKGSKKRRRRTRKSRKRRRSRKRKTRKFGNHTDQLLKLANRENERFYKTMIVLLKEIFKLTESEAIEVLYTNILHRMAIWDGSNNRNISSFDEFHDMVGEGIDSETSDEYDEKGYKLDKGMLKKYTQPYKEFKTLKEKLPTDIAEKIILQRINPKKDQRTGSLFNTGYLSNYPRVDEQLLTSFARSVVSSQRYRPNPLELIRQREIQRGLGQFY